jgi:hypothetical protein
VPGARRSSCGRGSRSSDACWRTSCARARRPA